MDETIKKLPAVALRGTTILPDMIVHFDVSRSKSARAVEEAMLLDQKLFLVGQKDHELEEPVQDDLYTIGTIASIKQVVKLPKNLLRVLVEGEQRAELISLSEEDGFLNAEVAELAGSTEELSETQQEGMSRALSALLLDFFRNGPTISKELAMQLSQIQNLEKMVNQFCVQLPFSSEQRQKLLEAVSLTERYELLSVMMANEIEVVKIQSDFEAKVKARIDQHQKEYFLREQLRMIHEELGDSEETDVEKFLQRTEKLKASKKVKEKIREEIRRFRTVGSSSAEAAVIRGYIETLLDLPWDKVTKDNQNLDEAEEILERDHYGLAKVKERILEFLAVRALTKKGDSPILCLVGPPGTGKTSIARSVARALNKKYVRISLGGVRDEAEIRGHRRTYVGAMPGRLAAGLKQAGVKNPLMLLDEIDKVSSDYKGDTSAALLEVLDSEQNSHFVDHYVEIPMDLSEVLFIATANDIQTIPRPLLDRMEVIEITSYTENEKKHIAVEHLIPKQIEANGLKEGQLVIEPEALDRVISGYTKEAGVRNLERKIGELCRKTARRLMQGETQVTVTQENLPEFLGKERYHVNMANLQDEIGVVRGLAWTSVGGDTLQIEVNLMPGKGEFLLTGQLGDVMKESAQTGISYLRSVAQEYGIPKEFFKENDIHIHIPEGAVPKDGPSAGITMATAMLSAMIRRPVRADVAMTGEITLRGRVLPIGGLKEKLLAAKKAGIRTVLVPKENRPDVEEMEAEITDGLEICFVEHMREVLERAFVR